MLFATQELAARIEAAERGLIHDTAAAASDAHPSLEVLRISLAGGLAAWCGPGSPCNKVVGLGFQGLPEEAELEAVERAYRARGAPVQVELSTLADPSVVPVLTARGYRLVGFENVLGLRLSPDTVPEPRGDGNGIEVTRSGVEEMEVWLDAVVSGFLTPDEEGVPSHESFERAALEEVMHDMTSAPSFVRYLARRDGEIAGGGSMRLDRGVAQMCGAATLPSHRRRGVQSVLLTRRLDDALQAGCDLAVVTTQPGSLSQRNMQRAGFELLYARAVLVLEAP